MTIQYDRMYTSTLRPAIVSVHVFMLILRFDLKELDFESQFRIRRYDRWESARAICLE